MAGYNGADKVKDFSSFCVILQIEFPVNLEGLTYIRHHRDKTVTCLSNSSQYTHQHCLFLCDRVYGYHSVLGFLCLLFLYKAVIFSNAIYFSCLIQKYNNNLKKTLHTVYYIFVGCLIILQVELKLHRDNNLKTLKQNPIEFCYT